MILKSFRRARARQAPELIACARFYAAATPFNPSPEQLEVVKWLKTHNVVVSARPGAGKTATAEALALENPKVPIAVITYSKRLQIDTEKRLGKYAHVDTYTFHRLAGSLFNRLIKDDVDLITERASRSIPCINDLPKYRFIVLDELQDVTENLYWLASTFIACIARYSGSFPGILILGDSRQAIYDFRGADSRFLEQAETIFRTLSDRGWKSLSLSQSFRLTRPTANFINNACLGGEPYILGTGDGAKPLYVRAKLPDTDDERLLTFLRPYIKKYGPDKCAILAPSVRGWRYYLASLSNSLSCSGVPVSVSIYDDAPLDEDVIRGKLVVSTYHQFKGSERDLVIVFGADDGWFKRFGRDVLHDSCPNPIFVALTRACKQLIIIQSARASPLPFIDVSALETHAELVPLHPQLTAPEASRKVPNRSIDVTDLLRHIRVEDLLSLVNQYTRIKKSPLPTTHALISPSTKVRTSTPKKDLWEYVADLSGIAVTAAFEWKSTSRVTMFSSIDHIPENEYERAVWFAERVAEDSPWYRSRWIQMKKASPYGPFRWLVGHLSPAVDRITKEIAHEGETVMTDLQFERQLGSSISILKPEQDKPEPVHIKGRADIIFNPGNGKPANIWEIKLVQTLKLESVAQIVAYGWLWQDSHPDAPFPRLVVFNVLDGERWEISTTKEEAREVVVGLLRAKRPATKLTDDEFREQCEKTLGEARDIIDRIPEGDLKPRQL